MFIVQIGSTMYIAAKLFLTEELFILQLFIASEENTCIFFLIRTTDLRKLYKRADAVDTSLPVQCSPETPNQL